MARKNGEITVEIMALFIDNPESILTTQEISTRTGIHKSSVSRHLKSLVATMQLEKIKAGHYRASTRASKQLPDFGDLDRKVTVDDLKRINNKLLDLNDRIITEYAPPVIRAYMQQGNHKAVIKLMRDIVTTTDQLLRRWNLLNRGYDANPAQAREDTKAKIASSETPEEPENYDIGHWDMDQKKMLN